jgi:transcriptional regulator PpsR
LADSLDAASVPEVRQLLDGLRVNGRSEPLLVRIAGLPEQVLLSASVFRQENSSHFLIRLGTQQVRARTEVADGKLHLLAVMESAPDAFLVTDLVGRILAVNRAFLEMAQLASEELARGESLEKWLGRTGVDLRVLISNLRQHGTVRLFATKMRGEYGSTTEVEISAVSVTTGDHPCLGFVVRDVSRRLASEARPSKELPRSASQMTDLVGRVPLRDIVRETTDLIEQLCIEAALDLTGDNRASAAEMLGLSRQSLYIKLRRFGIGESAGVAEH